MKVPAARIRTAASSTAVQEGIVSDDGEINVALLHLLSAKNKTKSTGPRLLNTYVNQPVLINRPDFGCVLLAREALQQSTRVHNHSPRRKPGFTHVANIASTLQ